MTPPLCCVLCELIESIYILFPFLALYNLPVVMSILCVSLGNCHVLNLHIAGHLK